MLVKRRLQPHEADFVFEALKGSVEHQLGVIYDQLHSNVYQVDDRGRTEFHFNIPVDLEVAPGENDAMEA